MSAKKKEKEKENKHIHTHTHTPQYGLTEELLTERVSANLLTNSIMPQGGAESAPPQTGVPCAEIIRQRIKPTRAQGSKIYNICKIRFMPGPDPRELS